LSAQAAIITAGLRPELFDEPRVRTLSRRVLILILALLVLAGFGLRIKGLSAEGLSDDEINKLQAVEEYRAHGLTSVNSEHPLLMKALLTASVVAAEKWNATSLVAANPAQLRVPVEAALRLPNTIFGALTVVLIYLLTAELFGTEAALIAAALWAFDPSALGFNRIVKEDTLLLFFFLLANIFWLRGQRIAEGAPERNPEPYYWATAAAYGAMMASKYVPFLIVASFSYYHIYQGVPTARWRIGKLRILIFFIIMGVVFLLCNPTILLPGSWHQMFAMASGKRVGHEGYEFMGKLYPNQMMDWFQGTPWYAYFVFIGVKLPLLTLAAFLIGVPLLFRRRFGEGRYFLFFWVFYAFGPFMLAGSKFTRYFTPTLPVVLITAAIGVQFVSRQLARQCAALFDSDWVKVYVRVALPLLVILSSAWVSINAAPHYRLYTNLLGGGYARAGDYFPHDEFYDASIRDVMFEIARRAAPGARVASETPNLTTYYAQQAGRPDLVSVYLSDKTALEELDTGDFIIAARGRRYFNNDALLSRLRQSTAPAFRVALGVTPSVDVHMLDEASRAIVATPAQQ
jgi:predicted membrane-bound dolichyl-phosphate-mannose-protein mannosyltransferase